MEKSIYLLKAFEESLKDRLTLIKRPFHKALILGTHHGILGEGLVQYLGLDCLVEVETTFSLLQKCTGIKLVADEEALPFADSSFDLIISCLSLQFANDLPGALLQIRRCLKPGGVFIGGVIGMFSLRELRSAWVQAEMEVKRGASPRVIPFSDVRDFGNLLQRAGFSLPVVDREILKVRYNSALDLMHDLRNMGAGNILMDRSRSPITRRLLSRVVEIYGEQFSEVDGRVTATFEIIVMTGWSQNEKN